MRWTIAPFLLATASHAFAQCDRSESVIESLGSVKDERIRHEVGKFITYDRDKDTAAVTLINVPGRPVGRERLIFDGQGVLLAISRAPFDSTRHTITWDPGNNRYACGIDGRSFWGTDGDLPSQEISELSVSVDGKRTEIPHKEWSDLFNPNLWSLHGKEDRPHLYAEVARSADRKRVYVHMTNSDGAGGYDVVWILINGKYARRVVDRP